MQVTLAFYKILFTMPTHRHSTRQRIIQAALELFASQGVTETTTRQIADLAKVNEVTLFRHFGNKHGLLLAVIEDASISDQVSESVSQESVQIGNVYQAFKSQARAYLKSLEKMPKFVQSVVGEAGQYPVANRRALGRCLTRANRYVARDLEAMLQRENFQASLPVEKLASLLNGMLLGYAIIEFSSEFHELWEDREDFLDSLTHLLLNGAMSQPQDMNSANAELLASTDASTVDDLPANLVHLILKRAEELDLQDRALAYVLFGAGLNPEEIANLQRSHYEVEANRPCLHVARDRTRPIPINCWIMGKRYGSATRNPLTQWLKQRDDEVSSLFINDRGQSLSIDEMRSRWQAWTEDLQLPDGNPLNIEQAQQTWCVEMLMKGMKLGDLSLLSGWNCVTLRPYARRAKEKAALQKAIRLDRKPKALTSKEAKTLSPPVVAES